MRQKERKKAEGAERDRGNERRQREWKKAEEAGKARESSDRDDDE